MMNRPRPTPPSAPLKAGFKPAYGYVDPAFIECHECGGLKRKTVGTKVVNQRADATVVYQLDCGHVVM